MTVDFQQMQDSIQKNTEMLININSKVLELVSTDYYMTVPEAAEYIKMSSSTIRRYLNEIKHFKRDRTILFKKSDLDNWVNQFSK